jgi:3-deoxy-D-manno-octulosonic acid kinase
MKDDRVQARTEATPDGAIIYDASRYPKGPAADWFAGAASTSAAAGRGIVHFVSIGERRAVLRHYHRGGAVARMLGDRYLHTSLRRSRPVREFHVLAEAYTRGLPVPRPIAGRYRREGLFYRADLLTEAVEPARTLASLVAHDELDRFDFRALGKLLRRFHDAGVFHADLNAHNVLLHDDGTIWLLDFDRGWLGEPRDAWRKNNLERLDRSLLKLGIERRVANAERDVFAPMRQAYAGLR